MVKYIETTCKKNGNIDKKQEAFVYVLQIKLYNINKTNHCVLQESSSGMVITRSMA